uniref:Uncharacterized protein n=1 Tax=Romanomermis culicivorax TaxID=13658 RepID=A0A915J2J7_ROMCU
MYDTFISIDMHNTHCIGYQSSHPNYELLENDISIPSAWLVPLVEDASGKDHGISPWIFNFLCAEVIQPFKPLTPLALLPPVYFWLSMTVALPLYLAISIAADRPANPPPMITIFLFLNSPLMTTLFSYFKIIEINFLISTAKRPKTTHSSSEFPLRRSAPCVPPAVSPTAYKPWMGRWSAEVKTRQLSSTFKPPNV